MKFDSTDLCKNCKQWYLENDLPFNEEDIHVLHSGWINYRDTEDGEYIETETDAPTLVLGSGKPVL